MSLNIFQFQDENENNTDRQALEKEIQDLISEINNVKHDIFQLYQKNRDSVVFESYNAKDEIGLTKSISIQDKIAKKQQMHSTKELMTLLFFQKCLKVKCKNITDMIRFTFPRFEKEKYGLQFKFKSGDSYILEKCFLPHTFNMKDERQNAYPVSFNEIPKYISIVMENINAYSLREKQVDELKKIADKRVMINHSTCYTEVEMNFKVLSLETNTRKCVLVNLFYPMLSILPSTVDTTVDGDTLLKRYLDATFAIFKENPLAKAYELAFVNAEQFKFFI